MWSIGCFLSCPRRLAPHQTRIQGQYTSLGPASHTPPGVPWPGHQDMEANTCPNNTHPSILPNHSPTHPTRKESLYISHSLSLYIYISLSLLFTVHSPPTTIYSVFSALWMCLPISYMCISLSLSLSLSLSISLSLSLSLSLSTYSYIYICMCVYVYIYV